MQVKSFIISIVLLCIYVTSISADDSNALAANQIDNTNEQYQFTRLVNRVKGSSCPYCW